MIISPKHLAKRVRSTSPGLSNAELRGSVERALDEDRGGGDLTTRLVFTEDSKRGRRGTKKARGTFFAQQPLVVAGLPVAREVFRRLDSASLWQASVEDGQDVNSGAPLAVVRGKAVALLTGERVALNFLQHLSGIATLTRQFKKKLAGLETELLDTRKTTPGLRGLEKYAVRMGGGRNHRMRLDDGVLIKNNHLRLAGGIRAAVESARRKRPRGVLIEVEVASPAELEQAMAAGADVVLLDNMTPEQVEECVRRAARRVRLEVSGGISAENIRAYAETGVDYVSAGVLTHSAPAANIHFLIEPV